jgi:hypothetical protein
MDGLQLSENIIIHSVMEQSKLHSFMATMDIGLALEPGKDVNNRIALSNKIITYAQSGLYILATDTYGQSQFLKSLDYNAGYIMDSTLEKAIKQLDKTLLTETFKINRWQNAKFFSWDNELLKLKKLLA